MRRRSAITRRLNLYATRKKQAYETHSMMKCIVLLTQLFFLQSHDGYGETSQAFIFSLQNNEGLELFKGMVKAPWNAVHRHLNHGITFGRGLDIYTADNAKLNLDSYTKSGFSYFIPTGGRCQKSIPAGIYSFTPDEAEMFYLV